MEMILSAGTPNTNMSGLAEKSCNNCLGKAQNIIVPHKAIMIPVGSKAFHA